jgi:hypothetical protein
MALTSKSREKRELVWLTADPRRIFASCLIAGAALLAACSGGSGAAAPGDPDPDPGTNGGPVGSGHAIDGGPVTGDGGPIDDPCVGVQCTGTDVCSAGRCVPNTTDEDKDGVSVLTDCDDKNPAIHPGAIEICNNKDENCDGTIDEGFDKDGDGFFQCAHGTKIVDCNDDVAAINDASKPATPTTSDLFAPVNTHWAKRGTADINTSVQGWSRLTDNLANQTGALWWNASYKFDHFEMDATFFIQNAVGGSNGLTFAWVPGTTLTTGTSGTGFGFKGLGGYAVVIDTSTATPSLALLTSAGTKLTTAVIPNVRDSASHVLRVVLDAGKLSVSIDGTMYVTSYTIAGYTPVVGHWGFTASTGTTGETHFLTDVSMKFPDGQACVL